MKELNNFELDDCELARLIPNTDEADLVFTKMSHK